MPFADLSSDDQLDLVSEALQGLLGDRPSRLDYLALCRAARTFAEAFEDAMGPQLIPGWPDRPQPVSAA